MASYLKLCQRVGEGAISLASAYILKSVSVLTPFFNAAHLVLRHRHQCNGFKRSIYLLPLPDHDLSITRGCKLSRLEKEMERVQNDAFQSPALCIFLSPRSLAHSGFARGE